MEVGVEVIVIIASVVAGFLIFRDIMLWYWRVNEITTVLHEINKNVAKLAGEPVETKPKRIGYQAKQGVQSAEWSDRVDKWTANWTKPQDKGERQ